MWGLRIHTLLPKKKRRGGMDWIGLDERTFLKNDRINGLIHTQPPTHTQSFVENLYHIVEI